MNYPIQKPEAQWREELTEFEYHVLREAGTELDTRGRRDGLKVGGAGCGLVQDPPRGRRCVLY